MIAIRSGLLAGLITSCPLVCLAAPADETYDGFEAPALSSLWRTDKLVAGALVLQTEVVRAGHQAVRLTIHPGDHLDAANTPDNHSNDANERDELQEANKLKSAEGEAAAYAFSLFLPKDFPVVPTRLVLAQWKQENDHATAKGNNPVIALRYESGELSVSVQTGPKKTVLFRTTAEIRGHWLDLIFQIRFRRQPDGFVRVWLDGKEVLQFTGQTAYDENYGYPADAAKFYFKMGLYRDVMAAPMTVYVDEYRKRPLTTDELKPLAFGPKSP